MPMSREVEIGSDKFTIQRFRGLKAIMAMASLTRIAREIPDIMADAVKAFQTRNKLTITEDMTAMPRWQAFTKEDFDNAQERTGKREIEVPIPMTQSEQVMYALPKLLENGRKEVVRLMALLIIPNKELMEADKDDIVEDALDKYYETLMYEAEIDQLVDLGFAAQDVLSEQLADRKDRLGKLWRSLGMARLFRPSQAPETPTSQENSETSQTSQQPTTEALSITQTSAQDAPPSSTPSDEHTDGTESQPSMASLGASS